MKHRVWFAVIATLGATVDLLSKELVFRQMGSGEELVVVRGFLEFGRTTNRGIVFGIAQGAGQVFLWVSILAVPAIVAVFLSLKQPRWVMSVSLGLILGGTIGNMVDRIHVGAVRDFIKFYYAPGRPWPLFNLADSCICVGVALLSLEMLFFDEKKKKKALQRAEAGSPVATAATPTEPMPRAEPPAASAPDVPPERGDGS